MCAEIYVLTVPSHEGTIVALSCGKKLRVYLVATDVPNRRTRAYTIHANFIIIPTNNPGLRDVL